MVALASNKIRAGKSKENRIEREENYNNYFQDIYKGTVAIKQRGTIKLLRNSKMLAKVN